MTEPRAFPFPTNPSRRERMTFEQQAGRTFAEMAEILGDPTRHHEFSATDETALLFMAVKRKKPDVSFDEVIDHDDWEIAPPEVSPSPLAPPTT